MRSQILITGSSGFLGRQILNIFDIDNVYTLNRANSSFNTDLSKKVPTFSISFEVVIHCAGKAHSIPLTSQQKQDFHNVNVIGTRNLLHGLELAPKLLKSFIFISSVAVYGIELGTNITEDNPLLAKDAYGLSKREAEHLVLDWCEKNNVICTILRLPLLVGKNPPGNLEAMLKAIRKGFYFNIGSGKAKKSMVLAEDVAQFLPIVAQIGGIYNLTDGVHPTFLDFSKAISKNKVLSIPVFVAKIFGILGDLIGYRAPINSLKVKKITSDLTFNDSKARAIGWKSKSILDYLKSNDL